MFGRYRTISVISMTCVVCDVRHIQDTMKITDRLKPGPRTHSSHALPTVIHLQKCQQSFHNRLIFPSRAEVRTGKVKRTCRGGKDSSMRYGPWHQTEVRGRLHAPIALAPGISPSTNRVYSRTGWGDLEMIQMSCFN